MDLDPIRAAMDHLEAAHVLLEPYFRGKRAPFEAIPGLAFMADNNGVMFAFNLLGGLLEYEEPRRAAVYAAEAALGGGEGAR